MPIEIFLYSQITAGNLQHYLQVNIIAFPKYSRTTAANARGHVWTNTIPILQQQYCSKYNGGGQHNSHFTTAILQQMQWGGQHNSHFTTAILQQMQWGGQHNSHFTTAILQQMQWGGGQHNSHFTTAILQQMQWGGGPTQFPFYNSDTAANIRGRVWVNTIPILQQRYCSKNQGACLG